MARPKPTPMLNTHSQKPRPKSLTLQQIIALILYYGYYGYKSLDAIEIATEMHILQYSRIFYNTQLPLMLKTSFSLLKVKKKKDGHKY